MLRRIAALTLVLLVIACAASLWLAHRAMIAPFVAPGAASVEITDVALGERQITYTMPNPDDGWQTAIARRLSFSGWQLAADRYQWGGTEKITAMAVYARTSQFWFLEIRERAELLGDRSNALIKLSYAVDYRW